MIGTGMAAMDPTGRLQTRGVARVPGTCGELVQGTINGTHFLVTCPIDIYSTATVELTENGRVEYPEDSPKAGAALGAALRVFGAGHLGARLALESQLPRGKGMGSSTADIAATVYACAQALGTAVDAMAVARLALAIEPTDGSMFPGIALFDHRRGKIYESLGPAPALAIVVLDFGGQVDTLEFNSVDRRALLRSLEPQVDQALRLVRRGVAEGRLDLVGEGATLSALANQRVLPKPQLPAVLGFARRVGALGIDVGHSGTVIGVLLDPVRYDPHTVLARARLELPGLELSLVCRLVAGGASTVIAPRP